MKFVHYAGAKGLKFQNKDQGEGDGVGLYKPRGLWLSVQDKGEDGWLDWCQDEKFGTDRMSYRYRVVLAKEAGVLHLKSTSDILRFGREYRVTPEEARGLWPTYDGELPSFLTQYINWSRVATRFPGIVIAPYNWNCRLRHETFWYYGWDCASGCIWDKRAIKSIRLDRTWKRVESEQRADAGAEGEDRPNEP